MGEGYDKVLVDAECTHDGSIKHLAKFDSWGWHTFEHNPNPDPDPNPNPNPNPKAELAVARLQCEQLQGHMAHLLEETREGASLAMVAAAAATGAATGTGPEGTGTGPGAGPGEAAAVAGAAVAGAAVLVVEGSWAADDLLEDTRPGEPSLKAIEAEL